MAKAKPFHMVRIDADIYEQIKADAENIDRPTTWLINQILQQYLGTEALKRRYNQRGLNSSTVVIQDKLNEALSY